MCTKIDLCQGQGRRSRPVSLCGQSTHVSLVKPNQTQPQTHVMPEVIVVPEGPHAGLYVTLTDDGSFGSFAYVKGETRPYATLSSNIIYDRVLNYVFSTSTPHTFIVNPNCEVATQSAQDEFGFYYRGRMPFCNGVVHAVKNKWIEFNTINYEQAKQILACTASRRPKTPDTIERVERSSTKPSISTAINKQNYDWFEENIDVDALLADLESLG